MNAARAVLLDIEGTTTPVDFVYRVLFPHAHARVGAFLARHAAAPQIAAEVERLREEHAQDVAAGRTPPAWADNADTEAAAAYARWLMDRDRKLTPLKALQGLIWEEGYRAGALRGRVYDDVPLAFERWSQAGRTIAIFSSGSVLAQKLLFAHTQAGDLTPYVSAYFDTTTGPKGEAESYRRIASALGLPAYAIVFVSDVAAELEAARAADCETALCVRQGDPPATADHRVVRSFDELG